MTTLDKVMQMQQQGISDADIINQLKNEGVSPTEISDSLNQAKIKNAISPMENPNNSQIPNQPPMPQDSNINNMQNTGMPEPEIYPPQNQYQYPEQNNGQQEYDQYPEQNQYQYPEQNNGQQEYNDYYQQTPQAYSDQGYYEGGGSANTENISEIAEQVITEKLNEYKQKVGDIVSFKNTTQDKINDIDDRLKRIESTIDKLQQAVIGKIGEFGETSAMIHKDLENLHGTVGKLMNPLIDTYKELKDKKK